MSSVQQLQVHNYNLKAALTVEQPVSWRLLHTGVPVSHADPALSLQSVQRAMVVLQDLLEIQCLASDVQQVPDIVKTIRKVRARRD